MKTIAENHRDLSAQLSEIHKKMLYVESRIEPDVVAERAYYTATTPAEIPDTFKHYQRRLGLVIPTLSPSGERGYRLRPNTPRKSKKGKPVKYEQAGGASNRLDVHPRNLPRLKDASKDLWFVEGEKKADALTSYGLCVVAVTGVWNFISKGKPVPCFDHIALKDRLVYICYDSDILTNTNVQGAAERLAGVLEERGATVLVVYLPDAPDGSKVGADDFRVSGGSVQDMRRLARPYAPENVREVRLSRDERLAAAVRDLWRRRDEYAFKGMRQHSARDALRVLIEASESGGKLTPEGVRISMASRTLALRARISRPTALKVLDWLEDDGWIRRDYEGRARDKAGAIILRTPRAKVDHEGHIACKTEGKDLLPTPTPAGQSYPTGKTLRAPSLCNPPALRWSGMRRTWTPDGYEYERIERLGKIAGAALDKLIDLGGDTTVRNLATATGSKRPRDLRRRHLSKLEAAEIITISEDRVTLTPEWRVSLDLARDLAGEPQADRLQREQYARQRQAFRDRDTIKPEPVPAMRAVEDLREHWSRHPSGCACSECASRFGRVIGEHVEGCRCAGCFSERRKRAVTARLGRRRGHLKVVEPPQPDRMREAKVIPTPPEPVGTGPGDADDWRDHALDCECDSCSSPAPRYARLKPLPGEVLGNRGGGDSRVR